MMPRVLALQDHFGDQMWHCHSYRTILSLACTSGAHPLSITFSTSKLVTLMMQVQDNDTGGAEANTVTQLCRVPHHQK